MSLPFRRALTALALLATTGCGLTDVSCTTDIRPALRVDVRDSVTNAPAGEGARIIARDGAFADTAWTEAFPGDRYWLAAERAGTYTLTVEQEGYATWARSGIKVWKDQCHVRTVDVTARLQR